MTQTQFWQIMPASFDEGRGGAVRGKTCGKTKFSRGKLAPPPGGPGKSRGRKTTFHAYVKITISKGPKAGPERIPQFVPRRIGHANFLTLNVQGTCCTGHPDQGHHPWLGPDLGRGLNIKIWLLCVLQPLFTPVALSEKVHETFLTRS